jgi:hypothetical protein
MLKNYLEELIKEWQGVALLIADVVIFAVSTLTQTFTLPQGFYWVVAGIAFVIANYRIYKRQRWQIESHLNTVPNIRSEFLESRIVIDAPVGRDSSRSDDGLSDKGLPLQPMLQAKMKVENFSHKSGTLKWYIDLHRSVIPQCFNVQLNSYDLVGIVMDDNQVLKIDDKSSVVDTWSLPLHLSIQDPKELASYLAKPDSYSICFFYSTQGSRWQSTPTLKIQVEGDLEFFKQSLIKKWEKRGMSELVGLAQGHNWDFIG